MHGEELGSPQSIHNPPFQGDRVMSSKDIRCYSKRNETDYSQLMT